MKQKKKQKKIEYIYIHFIARPNLFRSVYINLTSYK